MTRSVKLSKVFLASSGLGGGPPELSHFRQTSLVCTDLGLLPALRSPPAPGGIPSELEPLSSLLKDSCPDSRGSLSGSQFGTRRSRQSRERAERWGEPGWERLSRGLRFPPCVLQENCTDGAGSAWPGGAAQPALCTQLGNESLENTSLGVLCLWVSPEEGRCECAEIPWVP